MVLISGNKLKETAEMVKFDSKLDGNYVYSVLTHSLTARYAHWHTGQQQRTSTSICPRPAFRRNTTRDRSPFIRPSPQCIAMYFWVCPAGDSTMRYPAECRLRDRASLPAEDMAYPSPSSLYVDGIMLSVHTVRSVLAIPCWKYSEDREYQESLLGIFHLVRGR